jgi:chromosomal replication initiator protein
MSDITVDAIKRAVCHEFGITMMDLISRRKPYRLSHPRMVAMFLARCLTQEKVEVLGLEFGGRDHSTVVSGMQRVIALMKTDPAFALRVTALEARLRAPEMVEHF